MWLSVAARSSEENPTDWTGNLQIALSTRRIALDCSQPTCNTRICSLQFEITQTFLLGGDRVVEKRGRGDTWSYNLTEARIEGGQRTEHSSRIGRKTYQSLLKQKDGAKNQVKKKRTVFVLDVASAGRTVKHQIEEYINREGINLEVLQVEEVGDYQPPTFLSKYIHSEVEDTSAFSLSAIAKTNLETVAQSVILGENGK